MPISDLANWRLIFSDAFDTPLALGQFRAAVATRWSAYPSPWLDTSMHGRHAPQIVSVGDSVMDIWLHTEGGVHMAAAPVPLIGGWTRSNDQLYAQVMQTRGLQRSWTDDAKRVRVA